MAITKENGYPFDYDRVNSVFNDLVNVEIGRYTVSQESFEKIRSLLGLADLDTEEELRAVRNAVVRIFGKKEREDANIGEDGYEIPGKKVDYDKMMYWSTKISGITSVIDNELWTKGFPV